MALIKVQVSQKELLEEQNAKLEKAKDASARANFSAAETAQATANTASCLNLTSAISYDVAQIGKKLRNIESMVEDLVGHIEGERVNVWVDGFWQDDVWVDGFATWARKC